MVKSLPKKAKALFKRLSFNLRSPLGDLSLTGFTLTEVMVVIIIVAILASIAFPKYTKTLEIQRGKEAVVVLGIMHQALNFICMQTDCSVSCPGCINTADCNNVLNLKLRSEYWDFSTAGCIPVAKRLNGTYVNTLIRMDKDGKLCTITAPCTWPYTGFLK